MRILILTLRAQLYGWKVLYVPTAMVHHKVRSSIGHMSDTAVYYTLRNSELVRIKNVPLALFISCFPEFIMGMVTEFIYFAIKHKRLRCVFQGENRRNKNASRYAEKKKGEFKRSDGR